jgi:hypothetical protein
MNVTPGTFFARGHDYRADLARMVSEAYEAPGGGRRDARHRARPCDAVRRNRRRVAFVAEQLQRAKEAVQRQTRGWGLAGGIDAAGSGMA